MLKNLTFPQKLLIFITGAIILMGAMLVGVGCLILKKDPAARQSFRSFQRELGVDPGSSTAEKLVESGQRYVKLGDFDQAVMDYTAALKEPYEQDTTETAIVDLAKINIIEHNFDAAFKILNDGLKDSKKQYEILEQRAYMYKALGKTKEESEDNAKVVADLTEKISSLQYGAETGYFYWLRADKSTKLGDKEKATADYQKALGYYRTDEEPEDKITLYKILKDDTATQKEMRKDIEQLTDEISKDKDNADLYHHRAGVYEALNNLGAAVKDFERAKEIDPEADDYPTHLARIMVKRKQYAEASALFKELAERDEDDAPSWNVTAEAMVLAGQNKEAIEIAEKAIKLDPFEADGYLFKGRALKNLGVKDAEEFIKIGTALGYEDSI
jgi:hypothetical protein